MKISKRAVEELIFKGLMVLNDELPEDKRVVINEKTPLFGVDAQIDSLSLVSLIVDVETALNSDFDLAISLTDDRAMTRAESPFVSVQSLRDYIIELAAEV